MEQLLGLLLFILFVAGAGATIYVLSHKNRSKKSVGMKVDEKKDHHKTAEKTEPSSPSA